MSSGKATPPHPPAGAAVDRSCCRPIDPDEQAERTSRDDLIKFIRSGFSPPEGLKLEAWLAEKSGPCCSEHNSAYALWRFLLSRDSIKSRAAWQALVDQPNGDPIDRDATILRIWSSLRDQACDADRPGGDRPAYIDAHFYSRRYHEDMLFDWFMARYDLRRAREVRRGTNGRVSTLARNCHFLLLIVLLADLVIQSATSGAPSSGTPWLLRGIQVALIYGLVTVSCARLAGLPVAVFLQSLVPRLAGTAAVGFLFLMGESEMTSTLLGFSGEHAWSWLLGVIGALAYLLLEMARRVHPTPRLKELLKRGCDLLATGGAHACAIVLLGWRALGLGKPMAAFSAYQLLGVAVFVLVVGLVLNVIWAEEPVTQPL